MKNTTLPELLAPAGNLECAVTAYKNGADAVYAGYGKFNAREMADNFTPKSMSQLSAYAKKYNRKFYLTFNTLIKEGELEEISGLISEAAELEPDAFIVQDPGIVSLISNQHPDIPIHASTQMAIHNSAGIAAAARLGIERVILERQITLQELEEIVHNSQIELEVFIHGALCCSLSGVCLFSSWMGGWSGNRGRCKQPCRRRYHSSQQDISGFLFSTKDLYSLDLLSEYKRLGISSLKIEGRLKKPDYIRKVVSAYRMVLDTDEPSPRKILGEARNILAGSYGRKWSHGFAATEDMEELIQYDSMGVSGLLVGTLEKVLPKSIMIRLLRKVRIGDRLRIQPKSGNEGPSFTVTGMRMQGKRVSAGRKGEMVEIPVSKEIPSSGFAYKIGESEKGTSVNTETLPVFNPKYSIDLSIVISSSLISIKCLDREWSTETDFPLAEKKAAVPADIEQVFKSTRDDRLKAGTITIVLEPDLFIPAGQLKKIRREFWTWAGDLDLPDNPRHSIPGIPEIREILIRGIQQNSEISDTGTVTVRMNPSLSGEKVLQILRNAGASEAETVAKGEFIRSISISDALRQKTAPENSEVALPPFCSESDLPELKKDIHTVYSLGFRRFRITSLYQMHLIRELNQIQDDPRCILTSSFPLPVTNSLAAAALGILGIHRIQSWIELEQEALIALTGNSPLPVEVYRFGRPALLTTRAEIPVKGKINDSRGKQFTVHEGDGYPHSRTTSVFPAELFLLPQELLTARSAYIDVTHIDRKEKGIELSEFNLDRDFK